MLERVRHLRRFVRADRLPLDALLDRQSAALARLLDHAAAAVPFYRERHAGIDARAYASPLQRLNALPVVDKTALRAAGASAWDGPVRDDDRWIATSGSTGDPYRFPIAPAYDQQRKAQYLRPYLANGRALRDVVLRLTAFPRRGSWFTRLGLLRETQLACDTAPAAVLGVLRATRADFLQGYPSALRLLAHHARASGEPIPALRGLFTDSELLTAETRALLESTFGAPVRDVYGTFETDNIAFECAAGGGHHVTIDTVVVELLRDGAPVAPGEEGEVVVTVLDNLRSPFIRYDLRDLARWEPGSCRCGSALPRLRITGGRADDLLAWPDGSERSAMRVLGALDGFAAELVHMQLTQRPDASCELRYVPAPGAAADLAARLRAAATPHLGGCALTLTAMDAIPLTRAGKLRAFARVGADGR